MIPRISSREALAGMAFALCYPLGMPGYDLPVLPFLSLAPLIWLSSTAESQAHAARRAFAWGTLANLPIYYWIAWTVAVPGHLW